MESEGQDRGGKKIMFFVIIIFLAVVIGAAVLFISRRMEQTETVICDPDLDLPEGVNMPGYNKDCQPADEDPE